MTRPQKTSKRAAAGAANLRRYSKSVGGKTALKHGVYTALYRDTLPEELGYVQKEVDAIVAQMTSDLGGESVITAQERAVLEAERILLTVLHLAHHLLLTDSLLDKRGRPHAILEVAASYANSLRHCALALGLERREPEEDLQAEHEEWKANQEI